MHYSARPALSLVAVALLSVLQPAVRAQGGGGGDGSIRGVVTNAATGNYVESVEVSVVGGMQHDLTNSRGEFVIGGVPAGLQTIRVVASGFNTTDEEVVVTPGGMANVVVELRSDIIKLEPLMVSAQAEGEAQALNNQRNAESILRIASSEALAESRAGEVGEALQTLPGVYLQYSTHQPSTPVLRGIAAQYSTLTFDGIRAGNINGDRADTVNAFPAEALQRVEVIKSVTPDLDGDAIGGAINLVSKRAFDFSMPLLRLAVTGTYNNQQQNFDKQASFDFAHKFKNDRLGVYFSLLHTRSDRGYHEATQSYNVDSQDHFTINNLTLLDRSEDDSWKLKGSTSVEYKISANSTISFLGMYSNDSRFLEDHRIFINGGSRTFISPNAGATTGSSRLTLDRRYREPVSITQSYGIQMLHDFPEWKIDYRLNYLTATNTYSETFYPAVRTPSMTFTYDRTDRDFPTFTPTKPFDFNNPANYVHFAGDVARSQSPAYNTGYTADFNARHDLDFDRFSAYYKFGGRARFTHWTQDAEGLGNWSYTGPLPASAFLEPYYNDRFFREAPRGSLLVPHLGVALDPFLDAFHNRPNEFTNNALSTNTLLLSREMSMNEDIVAGYAMGGINWGRLHLLGGVRAENTNFSGRAYVVHQNATDITSVTRPRITLRGTKGLPSLHANYAVTPRLMLRAAVGKTLARPAGIDLLPTASISDTQRTVTIGNPKLGLTDSTNYDLSAEYYFKPLGVLSVSAFKKEIHGFYFDSASTIDVTTVPDLYFLGAADSLLGYTLNSRSQGRGGKIRGLEFEWSQRLAFLPSVLSGLSIGANYTVLDATGEYPNRPGADLPFIATAPRNGNFNVSYTWRGLVLKGFYNYRSEALQEVGSRASIDVYEAARETVDASISYRLDRQHWWVALTGKNLTNTPRVTYQGDRGNPRSVRYFDWSLAATVAYEF